MCCGSSRFSRRNSPPCCGASASSRSGSGFWPCSTAATSSSSCKQSRKGRRLVIMRKIGGLVLALAFAAVPLAAGEQAEHLEHLRMMMRAMSSHGPVIPQPEAIGPNAVTINITARQGSFSPSSFSVNQGDVVTLTVAVPSNAGSSVGHGILMETYIDPGVNVSRGSTRSVTFTATTPGTFAFVCTQSSCGTSSLPHSNMFGQMVVNAVSNPPSIGSVFPASGSTDGGTTVTISGSNFQTSGTTSVKFDTAAATNVNVTSASSMTAVTPPHAAGAVNVTVTNPNGQSATASNAFTYNVPGPSITAINPTTG